MRGLEGLVRGVSGRCGKRGPPRVVGRVAPRESLSEGRWGYPEDSNSGTQTPEGSGGGGR